LEDAQKAGAMEKPKADSEGWIDYDGSGQPVDDFERVDIFSRLESSGEAEYIPDIRCAYEWDWRITGGPADIIRYRIKA
jgi:hypothetical protein